VSTFNSMSRARGLAAGVAVAILLIPTAVGATVGTQPALKLTGIEGTSGNQADVTGAGQLLTTEAAPSTYTQSTDVDVYASGLALEQSRGSLGTIPSSSPRFTSTVLISVDRLRASSLTFTSDRRAPSWEPPPPGITQSLFRLRAKPTYRMPRALSSPRVRSYVPRR
jgi:hypothetical protein